MAAYKGKVILSGTDVIYTSEYGKKIAKIGDSFTLINSEKTRKYASTSVKLLRYIDEDFAAVQTGDEGEMRPVPWKSFFRRYVPYAELYTDSPKIKNGVEGAKVLAKEKRVGSRSTDEELLKTLKGIERALWALVKTWQPEKDKIDNIHQGNLFTANQFPHDPDKTND